MTSPHVVLVGPPGAGKTTVGGLLARALHVELYDADAEVERTAGTTIPELFRTHGEEHFRHLEHETVTRLLATDAVVSLGGGAVLHPGTREALRGHTVVYLDVDVEEALVRVSRSEERPLLAGDPAARLAALVAERRPVYEAVATAVVRTNDRSPQNVAEEILALLSARARHTASTTAAAGSPAPVGDPAPADTPTPAGSTVPAGTAGDAGGRTSDAETAGRIGVPGAPGRIGVPGAPGRISVAGANPYDVVVGHDLGAEVVDLVGSDASRVLVVHAPATVDRARRLGDALSAAGREVVLHEVPDAEAAKTIDVVARCWDRLGEHRFGRQDVVVAVGGGATTDVAGFVAASWLRGVRLVNVPTTLLGMVDAALGGKTGINTAAGKNLVGAFHPPAGVVCDLAALTTLPAADLRAGLAEVVKAGFIADERILDLVEADGGAAAQDPASPVLRELVQRAVAVKARVVGEDLREAGLREILNYGHTLAHAIERTEAYSWRHGDAVAVGMVFAAELAHAAGMLDAAVVDRHRKVLSLLGLPTTYRGDRWPELHDAMARDKKVRDDALRFVVLTDIAEPTVLRAPTPEQLRAAYSAVSA
ncbi:3-dehydroquinate synthase [Georgenia subflava]|uniref:Multifunctional fusion protein n=1 Tax=Georgenia subflava TaxID=1622177 RepID=A0A6N7EIM6_9MICO|nr:3-dehydroquinate synthase [Georgenia subflava]MPV37999.1 3-dehydroquinate synthase [Georgenia subflava]